MITLADITEENLGHCEALEWKSQKYVGGPLWVIAEAYVHRQNTTAYAICADGVIVGLVNVIWNKRGEYSFTDLFIADPYQNRGYGKQAVAAILDLFRARKEYPTVSIFVHDSNAVAIGLYRSCGFVVTGKAEWNEHFLVMRYRLS